MSFLCSTSTSANARTMFGSSSSGACSLAIFVFFLTGKGESSYVGVGDDAREREEKARKREENWSLSERQTQTRRCKGTFAREFVRWRCVSTRNETDACALLSRARSFLRVVVVRKSRTSGVTAPETGSLSAFSPNRAFVCIKFYYATTKTHIYFFHITLCDAFKIQATNLNCSKRPTVPS
jgi:hypothetical protein